MYDLKYSDACHVGFTFPSPYPVLHPHTQHRNNQSEPQIFDSSTQKMQLSTKSTPLPNLATYTRYDQKASCKAPRRKRGNPPDMPGNPPLCSLSRGVFCVLVFWFLGEGCDWLDGVVRVCGMGREGGRTGAEKLVCSWGNGLWMARCGEVMLAWRDDRSARWKNPVPWCSSQILRSCPCNDSKEVFENKFSKLPWQKIIDSTITKARIIDSQGEGKPIKNIALQDIANISKQNPQQ